MNEEKTPPGGDKITSAIRRCFGVYVILDNRDVRRFLARGVGYQSRVFCKLPFLPVFDSLPDFVPTRQGFWEIRDTPPDGIPWHCDAQQLDGSPNHMPWVRYTLSLALTPPHEYAGGELIIGEPGGNPTIRRGDEWLVNGERFRFSPGVGALFPGHVPHMVTPVTRGRRIQLIAHFGE